MNERSYDITRDAKCETTAVDCEMVAQVVAALPQQELADAVARLFDALSDPTRLRVLNALAVSELCVCDLAEIAEVSQSGVSHQLRVLRDLDLVAFRREGRRAIYRLADEHVRALVSVATEHANERFEGDR